MALDLVSHAAAAERNYIVSLEGDTQEALRHWPRLAQFSHRLVFLGKKPGWNWRLVRVLRDLFREVGATSVHTHHIGPLVYGGLAARAAGIEELIHTEHDAWHLRAPKRRILQRAVLRIVRPTLVADAEAVATGVRTTLGIEQVGVIRNGIDTARFVPGDQAKARTALGLPLNVRLVGTAGRLEPVKGHQSLIEALRLLPKHVHLAIAGNGSQMPVLQEFSLLHGLHSRVHFLGRVDDMPRYYQALDLLCLPSHQEGMPLAPMEAQACGIPTVATAAGGTPEAVCPKTGALVPVGSVRALALALRRRLYTPMRASPREFARKRCDVRNMTEAYAALRAS